MEVGVLPSNIREKVTNLFYELLGITGVFALLIAFVGLVYGIYGEETAKQTAWILLVILGCMLGFDCAIANLRLSYRLATDRIHGIGSTRSVLRSFCGAIIIVIAAGIWVEKYIQDLYALENNNVFALVAVITLAIVVAIILMHSRGRKKMG